MQSAIINSNLTKGAAMVRKILFQFPRWLVLRPPAWFVFWGLFMPVVFFTDRYLSSVAQLVPAAVITWMLVGALTTRPRREQLLLVTLVIVATSFEVLGSLILHWYAYRLHNIPAWIPPGHGVVFFTALLAMEQRFAVKHARALRIIATFLALSYSIIGLIVFEDFAGAVLTALFLVWLWLIGHQKARFYTWLWLLIFALELSGVWLGAWHWGIRMPVTGLPENSPPSGIVGAYGVFDLLAFVITAGLVSLYPLIHGSLKKFTIQKSINESESGSS
jgi:hypothetical protein